MKRRAIKVMPEGMISRWNIIFQEVENVFPNAGDLRILG
jgi:hypothetical protein